MKDNDGFQIYELDSEISAVAVATSIKAMVEANRQTAFSFVVVASHTKDVYALEQALSERVDTYLGECEPTMFVRGFLDVLELERQPDVLESVKFVLGACKSNYCSLICATVRDHNEYREEEEDILGVYFCDEGFPERIWNYVQREGQSKKATINLNFNVESEVDVAQGIPDTTLPGTEFTLTCNAGLPGTVTVANVPPNEASVKLAVRAFMDYCKGHEFAIEQLEPSL